MALTIRLRKQGRKNAQTFRLIVTDSRTRRDGKYLETLGWYTPFRENDNLSVKADRVAHYLDLGATLSESAMSLLAKAAPQVIQKLKAKQNAKRVKMAAKRRELKKKKAGKTAAPVKKAAAKKDELSSEEKKAAPRKKSTKAAKPKA